MQNIKIEINGVTKNLVLLDMNKEANKAAHFISGKWYQEVEEKKDYEIQSFKFILPQELIYDLRINGDYWMGESASLPLKACLQNVAAGFMFIHSVKRLSDGEVFTVKEDEINGMGKIIKIEIWHGHLFLYSTDNNYARLDYAVKNPTPTILLTTHDGAIVTNPDTQIYICHKNFNHGQTTAGAISTNQNNIYFYDKKARDNYIIQNKPVAVSCIEIAKAVTFTSDQLNQLVEFFKRKNS